MTIAGSNTLRAVFDARLPESAIRPGRPIAPRWFFLLAAAATFLLSLGALGALQIASFVYAAVVTAPVLLAWRRPGLAAVLAVLVVAASTIAALAGSPTAAPPPWFLNIAVAHLVIGYVAGLSFPVRTIGWVFSTLPVWGLGHAVLLFGFRPSSLSVTLIWAAEVTIAVLLGMRHRDRHERLRGAVADAGRRRIREEHDRVARELHDSVAHHLSELAVRAASAPQRIPDVSVPAAAEFTALGELARSALTEMRGLLGILRGDVAPDRGPQPGLADIGDLAAAARRSGTPTELAITEPLALPPGIGVSTYRIVQESLSNVVRHATGASTSVTVAPAGDELHISIINAAAPQSPAPAPGAGLGLVGMRERVRLLRGRIHTGPTTDGGFLVDVRLPLEPLP
ncbi:sensor histidine kinase [Pseudonocardia sp. TRM90224]|uniref:sensor histidine kinase n=1 Tax=Pseudonocardia sp. TRM90224 TaxID=2812678 RepID=UPI001E4612B3|nr:histidine kinase [Pseudonocardia sp. TRM90224]